MTAVKDFVLEWGWVILNSLIWGYAGYSFSRRRRQSRRWLQGLSPRERLFAEGMQIMEKRARHTAWRHPFWGKAKREAFFKRLAQETVLMQLGYEPGDPCPLPCDRGYVDVYNPEDPFPERVPCPACRMIKEVHGVAPAK